MRAARFVRPRVVVVASVIAFAVAELGIFGCNAILGNSPGVLLDASSSTSTLTCAPGKKACAGICSGTDQAAVGCSGTCSACATPANAVAGCTLEDASYFCGIKNCNDQYADCDNDIANGCETHTTTRAHCGSCNGDCTQQFCERQGSTYVCSDTCDEPNTPCASEAGTECTDPKTDNDNCGGCGVACSVPNGSGTCNDGGCTTTCNDKYFLCNHACGFATAQQCGPSCAPCPPGNVCDTTLTSPTYATCVVSNCTQSNTTCGVGCATDCTLTGDTCVDDACTTHGGPPGGLGCPEGECSLDDGGCTTDLTTSPNCGSCGVSCDDQTEFCCSNEDIGPASLKLNSGGVVVVGQYSCTQQTSGVTCNP